MIDGALLHALRVPLGYWEAKDEKDNLDDEIEIKFRRGYPQDNIIFDDSHTAVLIQNNNEVMRCGVEDVALLEKLLNLFFGYERPEIADFRQAVEQFKADLPAVLQALRGMIDKEERDNAAFRKAATKFLKHAQDTGTPWVTVRPYYEGLPSMAGLGRAKEVKASGSGPRISRSARVQEARSRGVKSPLVERREACVCAQHTQRQALTSGANCDHLFARGVDG